MPATQQAPQQFIDSTDGVRIAVYEEGNPEGPTVVLVHGFPDSHVLWDGVVPRLAERFRVIRYDNRGTQRAVSSNEYGRTYLSRVLTMSCTGTSIVWGRPRMENDRK